MQALSVAVTDRYLRASAPGTELFIVSASATNLSNLSCVSCEITGSRFDAVLEAVPQPVKSATKISAIMFFILFLFLDLLLFSVAEKEAFVNRSILALF